MQDANSLKADEKLNAWISDSVNSAVKSLTSQGLFDGVVVEAKPAWVLPGQILIGKLRERDNKGLFYWFICGDLPTDSAPSSVASNAREAARHFSMKWQLDAERRSDGASVLVQRAEALYGLTEEPALWDQA